jgi:diguanylate cyclase (GGDEF)-like protein
MRLTTVSAPVASPLVVLLSGAETLSRTRDLREIFRITAETAMRFVDGSYGLLFAVRFTPPDLTVGLLGCCVSDGTDTYWDDVCDGQSWLPVDPLLADCLHTDFGHAIMHEGDTWRLAFAVGALGQARWVLEIHSPTKPRTADCQALYPLPALLRKPAPGLGIRQPRHPHPAPQPQNLRRRLRTPHRRCRASRAGPPATRRTPHPQPQHHPTLLARVVDIDHFKKINDNYGHLFGDEVLLRVADLMRQSFRNHDKLFRFGGEEFVVMLRNVGEDNVQTIFDRFRVAVEDHDFPRVGQVRCSVGYSRIDPRLSPAELLGRADEALYYSKEHGRNQVNGFDELIMSGKLRINTPAGQAQIQSDIDEIFL